MPAPRARHAAAMTVLLFAVLGAAAGAGAHRLVARLAGRHPPRGVCEAAAAAGGAVAVLATATAPGAAAVAALIWWCVCLSAADLSARRLPNVLTVPGAAVVLAVAAGAGHAAPALAGAVLLAGPYLLAHLAAPRSLGAGDVKLAAGLGAAAGANGAAAWTTAALLPPLLTAAAGAVVVGAGWVRAHRRPRGVVLPHGPSMCAAAVAAVLAAG
ncbi:peptidase, A24 (type IV prepilin peptidase) family protein [Rhodococcus aetherivorans]|nr:peptidase A24 [Rhodococcus aetherivorans]CCW15171.1 peptidase, A24 (type IV prepilin peptidase) family protein [Rhodococcus aetherivorans]